MSRSGSEILVQNGRCLALLRFVRELLHICHTSWMSRDSRGNYVVDELYMYVQGRCAG